MPIKSLFVPSYAIQGEDIPAHILWDSLSYQSIKIQLPETIKLKELYNVEESMFSISDKEILIKEVAVGGYLGMLFSTSKLKEYFAKVGINFSFFDESGKKIVDESRVIQLFRPELEVVKVPEIISVDPVRNFVFKRIKLRKQGQGTLIINFSTPKESEVQKRIPDHISEFINNFKRDFKENLVELEKSFPQYSSLISRYIDFITGGWTSYDELNELKTLLEKLYVVFAENESFTRALLEALRKSIVLNIKLFTLPESLLKYLDSVLSRKVWLLQPWQIIPVSKEPKILLLEIFPTDLLLDSYELTRLQPVKIQGESDGYIEIARLFEWEEAE